MNEQFGTLMVVMDTPLSAYWHLFRTLRHWPHYRGNTLTNHIFLKGKLKGRKKEKGKKLNKIKESKRVNLNVSTSHFLLKPFLFSVRIRRCQCWSMIPFGHWFTKNIWYTTAMFKLRSRISDISGYMASNDFSINAENVERYFDRIENCQ